MDRDKFLVEAMGEKWYGPEDYNHNWPPQFQNKNIDLSTNDGFGRLLSWAKKQEFWKDFIEKHGVIKYRGVRSETYNLKPKEIYFLATDLLDANIFADTLYEFLNNK